MQNSKPEQRDTGTRLGTVLRRRLFFPREAKEIGDVYTQAKDGETSRFFFRLEKRRGANDWISSMKTSDGSILSDISDICTSWRDFYLSLFTAWLISCPMSLLPCRVTRLSLVKVHCLPHCR